MNNRDFILLFGGLIGLPVTLVIGAAVMWDAYRCSSTAGLMGVPYSYSVSTDCMVKVDDRWEPMNWQRSVRIKE